MPKPKMVKSALDKRIATLVRRTGHKTLAVWACDCAERVLPYFEKKYPRDDRPRLAIEAGRTWVKTGIFSMAVIRKASLSAHAAARETEEQSAARSAARAAGQAVATAHVPAHSIAAAMYAATVVRDVSKPAAAEKAVSKERVWQYRHLLKLRKRKQC